MAVACLVTFQTVGRCGGSFACHGIPKEYPGDTKVTIDSGHQSPEGAASPALRAGIVRQAAFCCVLLAAVSSAVVSMSAWSLRENILSALVAVLAVLVGLL